jgi:hypothetical protein
MFFPCEARGRGVSFGTCLHINVVIMNCTAERRVLRSGFHLSTSSSRSVREENGERLGSTFSWVFTFLLVAVRGVSLLTVARVAKYPLWLVVLDQYKKISSFLYVE